jgi:hypothetical protein
MAFFDRAGGAGGGRPSALRRGRTPARRTRSDPLLTARIAID